MPEISFPRDKTGEISGPASPHSSIDPRQSEESHERVWSLSQAISALPEIRIITEETLKKFKKIQAPLDADISKEAARRIEIELAEVFGEWSRVMIEKGIHVKGPWLCDFDSGDGYYYCWKYPEEQISYFHLYDSGFEGRRPISFLKSSR